MEPEITAFSLLHKIQRARTLSLSIFLIVKNVPSKIGWLIFFWENSSAFILVIFYLLINKEKFTVITYLLINKEKIVSKIITVPKKYYLPLCVYAR